jgi:hypothetical protein
LLKGVSTQEQAVTTEPCSLSYFGSGLDRFVCAEILDFSP